MSSLLRGRGILEFMVYGVYGSMDLKSAMQRSTNLEGGSVEAVKGVENFLRPTVALIKKWSSGYINK